MNLIEQRKCFLHGVEMVELTCIERSSHKMKQVAQNGAGHESARSDTMLNTHMAEGV